eukprot:scaffold15258_cov49-Attheya_sp.AAC.3
MIDPTRIEKVKSLFLRLCRVSDNGLTSTERGARTPKNKVTTRANNGGNFPKRLPSLPSAVGQQQSHTVTTNP